MRRTSFRACWQLAVLALLIIASLLPIAVTRADPLPPTPTPAGESQSSADAHPYAAEVLDPNAPPIAEPERPADGATAEAPLAGPMSGSESAPATEASPDGTPALLGAEADGATPAAEPKQGVVTLDVSAPVTIRRSERIYYTYRYHNTGATPVHNVLVDATWINFTHTTSSSTWPSDWQYGHYCAPPSCTVETLEGPDVTIHSPIILGTRFLIGDLAPGQHGAFTVELQILSRKDDNSKLLESNGPLTRPASSGVLFVNNESISTSEDTANTLLVGPVIALTKTTDTSRKIYTGETAEFTIQVGNATGSGDIVNGQVRGDARPAANLVVRDTFPTGGEFVSATGSPVVDTAAKTVTWTVAGPLNPGQHVDLKVVFRKADLDVDCTRLDNRTYSVSYDDPDPADGANRYTDSGRGVAAPVVVPLPIKAITATPSKVPFDAEATLSIVVQNFWSQPLNGVQLHYELQSNVYYLPGQAAPAPTTAPDGTHLGGKVVWTFNTPAASKTTPSEHTFSVRVRAGTSTTVAPDTAHAWIVAPVGVPVACSNRDGKVTVEPGLRLTKTTDADPLTKIGDTYIVVRGQQFAYRIEITNSSPGEARGVNIADAIPGETGANFSYVDGSATVNGAPREPDAHVDGQGGSINWNNLVVPAGGTIRIDYSLRVDGRDYWKYCNTASATSGTDKITYGPSKVCVKINPKIEVDKQIVLGDGSTVKASCANPGQEVKFRLTLTNKEATAYTVGLYDMLGSGSRSFEFVRQESGYAAPSVDMRFGNGLQWPLLDLQPNGQLQATIVARIPSGATPGDYTNEVLFHNDIGDVIQRIPKMTVKVHTPCIEFSKSSNRDLVSLRDRLVYTLELKNASASVATNVTAEDQMPVGFTYVGMEGSSDVKTAPVVEVMSDGRQKLTWSVSSIAALATTKIKFIARAADVISVYTNQLIVPGGTCTGSRCDVEREHAFQSVTVAPLITMEPKIIAENPDECVAPGTKRIYQLSILNTNNHDYLGTAVRLSLPFGLEFLRTLDGTSTPTVTSIDGKSILSWSNMRVPAKPAGSFAAQVVLKVELRAGQVFGQLATEVQTTSDDGLIPHKEGVLDPSVWVCTIGTKPVIAMEAYPRILRVGDDVIYQISLANPTTSSDTVTVEDQLPAEMTFVSMVAGAAPNANGNTLTWNVSLPAASGSRPGVVTLRFKARLASGTVGATYTNTARVTASSLAFDPAASSAAVVVADEITQIFLPLVRR